MSSRVEQIMLYVDSKNLSRDEFFQLHRQVGNIIKKRMYYQLIVNVPWLIEPVYYDHTDRFEEVLKDLTKITIDMVNEEVGDITKLPDDIFMFNKDRTEVVGLRPECSDEQNISNIYSMFLNDRCKYRIDQFEVDFGYTDPYYR